MRKLHAKPSIKNRRLGVFVSYVGSGSENYSLNSVSYDLNGNITALSRNGLKSDNTFGLIDDLAYTYQANSNKIQKVDDNSGETASFTDATGDTDYTYSQDGSLTSDNNKGISVMEYNYLKLPRRIVKNGVQILYQYDATGKKLKETIGSNVTDYNGNTIYKNGALYQISHDEGRIINGEYEYNIKDHLGNLRVAFRDSLGIAKVVQYENRGAWGESLEGINYSKANRNKFNYSTYEEENDFGLGVLDAHARVYDPIAPHFWQIDPLAEISRRFSPYTYANNNPLRFIDPDGMAVESIEGGVRFTGDDAGNAFSVLTGKKHNVMIDITKEKDAASATGRTNYDNWAVFSVSNIGLAHEALNSFNKGSIKNLVLGSHGISVMDFETHSELVGLRFKTDDIRNQGFLWDDVKNYNDNGSVSGNRGENLGITVLKNILDKVEVGGNCIFAVCYLGASQGDIGKNFATQLSTLSENKLTLYTYTDGAAVWHFKDGQYKGAIGIGGDARLEAKGSPSSAHWNVIKNKAIVNTISQIILSDSSNPIIFKK